MHKTLTVLSKIRVQISLKLVPNNEYITGLHKLVLNDKYITGLYMDIKFCLGIHENLPLNTSNQRTTVANISIKTQNDEVKPQSFQLYNQYP